MVLFVPEGLRFAPGYSGVIIRHLAAGAAAEVLMELLVPLLQSELGCYKNLQMLASISLQPSSHENVDAVLLRLKVRPQENLIYRRRWVPACQQSL